MTELEELDLFPVCPFAASTRSPCPTRRIRALPPLKETSLRSSWVWTNIWCDSWFRDKMVFTQQEVSWANKQMMFLVGCCGLVPSSGHVVQEDLHRHLGKCLFVHPSHALFWKRNGPQNCSWLEMFPLTSAFTKITLFAKVSVGLGGESEI